MSHQITKESLDLITALKPFTGQKGRSLIDTLVELCQEPSAGVEGMEITTLAEKARGLLTARVESAISLFLILVVVWLSQVMTASLAHESDGPAG
ncbi:MAG: hypothetical protein IMF26_08550 [Candidatus Fermentithermobacillus carboniphilus]|uniref:Uncharacterized protein n=1 Tax=Candidatus Fermentithermobacillus carboniphilus TaxID=3085328 RepID=A0AAT9LAK0_9FIRM|nr:MAG: hypothetical protein IMF26_08550 [Candidatus Fermentithermobacillus carboniphilus]